MSIKSIARLVVFLVGGIALVILIAGSFFYYLYWRQHRVLVELREQVYRHLTSKQGVESTYRLIETLWANHEFVPRDEVDAFSLAMVKESGVTEARSSYVILDLPGTRDIPLYFLVLKRPEAGQDRGWMVMVTIDQHGETGKLLLGPESNRDVMISQAVEVIFEGDGTFYWSTSGNRGLTGWKLVKSVE